MTNIERILAVLREHDGLDDDELSARARVTPRQAVNQICRKLESQGILKRNPGTHGKIVNRLCASGGIPRSERLHPAPAYESRRHTSTKTPEVADSAFRIPDPNKTLLIIPCSASKIPGSFPADGHSILEFLPEPLAQELKAARAAVAAEAGVDESAMMPAWRRYNGQLYTAAGFRLEQIIRAGVRVLIVSGGYGLLLAEEPIGSYDMLFRSSRWPKGLLERALETLVQNYGLTAVRAFASASTDYGRLIRRVRWRDAGVRDGWLFTPSRSAGALLRSPRAQGEALAALVDGRCTSGWASSDGLPMETVSLI